MCINWGYSELRKPLMDRQTRKFLRALQQERFGPLPVREKVPTPAEKLRELVKALSDAQTTRTHEC